MFTGGGGAGEDKSYGLHTECTESGNKISGVAVGDLRAGESHFPPSRHKKMRDRVMTSLGQQPRQARGNAVPV